MSYIVNFIFVFVIVYLGHYLFIIRDNKKYNFKNCPMEALYVIRVYKLDMQKIDYRKLLKIISFTNALIIAITTTILILVHKLLVKLILGFFLLILLILIGYALISVYYKKKGMTFNA